MTTLLNDATSISNALTVPRGKTFCEHLKEAIEAIPNKRPYSNKVIELLQMALEPSPVDRYDAKQLKSLL
jgi:hypothetical protein